MTLSSSESSVRTRMFRPRETWEHMPLFFEPPRPCSFLCVNRVPAIPWHSPCLY